MDSRGSIGSKPDVWREILGALCQEAQAWNDGGLAADVKQLLADIRRFEEQPPLVIEGLAEDHYPPSIQDRFYALLERVKVIQFLFSCWRRPTMVIFMLKQLAARVFGREGLEEFTFWFGPGGNGKGVLTWLLDAVLGSYHYEPDYSTFCIDFNPANPNPESEVMQTRGRRILSVTESEKSSCVKSKTLKLWTDATTSITARGLYKEPISFRPFFGIQISTNNPAKFSSLDGGIRRRMTVVPFPISFVEENPQGPNEALQNVSLKTVESAQQMAPEFLFLLMFVDEIWFRDGVKATRIRPQPLLVQRAFGEFGYVEHQSTWDEFYEQHLALVNLYKDGTPEARIKEAFCEYSKAALDKKTAVELLKYNAARVEAKGKQYLRPKNLDKGWLQLKTVAADAGDSAAPQTELF